MAAKVKAGPGRPPKKKAAKPDADPKSAPDTSAGSPSEGPSASEPEQSTGRKRKTTAKGKGKGAPGEPRKRPAQYEDKAKAVKRKLDDLNKTIDADTKERADKGLPPQFTKANVTSDPHRPPYKGYPLEACVKLTRGTWGGIGSVMGVDKRPADRDIQDMAEALQMTSQYYDFLHPKYMCLLMLGGSALSCAKPMWGEFREKRLAKKAGKSMRRETEAAAKAMESKVTDAEFSEKPKPEA